MNRFHYELIKYVATPNTRVLEIGSRIFDERYNPRKHFYNCEFIGIDMNEGAGVDMVCNSHSIPFNDNSFGIILYQSVLEHDSNPQATLSEISRLLSSNGKCLISVPFSQAVHGYPYDYWRVTTDGLRLLMRKYFKKHVCYSVGPALNPHTIIGMVNADIPDIDRLNRKWKDRDGNLYWILYAVIPQIFFRLFKRIKYGRYY